MPTTLDSTMLLIRAVQELSLARDLESIQRIVRKAARRLAGADGATFVLRDNGQCYYADEDAIAPLWMGKRFPMQTCISGWVMLNRKSTVIPDIYADARIPADAYRPTFVKSLAMVPIRMMDPIGAVGVYWARPHEPAEDVVTMLQALADSTAVAMENVQVYSELEQRVRDRTADLKRFAYVASHDLQTPLRGVASFAQLLEDDYKGQFDERGRYRLQQIVESSRRMQALVSDLLTRTIEAK